MLKTFVLFVLVAAFVFAEEDTQLWRLKPKSRYVAPRPNQKKLNPLKQAIFKFQPVIYLPKGDSSFPTAIQKITTWQGVTDQQLVDEKYTLQYTWKGPSTFDPTAPLYVNIRKLANGNYWIAYTIIQAYNDCGPDLRIKAKVAGAGPSNLKVTLCPFGVHYGDHEHVTVELPPSLDRVLRVSISYHHLSTWYNPNQLRWEGSHPRIYMAVGSHALYYAPGPQRYLKIWDETSTFKLPCVKMCEKDVPYPCGVKKCHKTVTFGCPKICKKWRIKYPCGWNKNCGTKRVPYPCGVKTCYKKTKYPCPKLCPHTAETSGWFVDYPPNSEKDAHRWFAPLRIVAKDGKSIHKKPTTGVAEVERKMTLFKGRFGPQIVNHGWRKFQDTVLKLTYPVRKVSSKADAAIKKGLKDADSEAQSTSSSGLGGKGWFGGNDPNNP